MNYNRRSTRPDGLFYRDQRKLRGSPRGRGGAVGGKPLAIGIAVVAAVALVVYFLLFRH